MAVSLEKCNVSIMAFQRETLVPGGHPQMLPLADTMNAKSYLAYGQTWGSVGEA